MTSEGYLVVMARPDDVVASENPSYRGLYRTPPWSQELYEAGFDDPYVFGDYTDNHGLIKDYGRAREVLRIFASVHSESLLEIVYVQEYVYQEASVQCGVERTFIGIDVADLESPHWSCVYDFPLDEDIRESYFSLLNKNGLFAVRQVAERYLEDYRNRKLPHSDAKLVLWAVYSLE